MTRRLGLSLPADDNADTHRKWYIIPDIRKAQFLHIGCLVGSETRPDLDSSEQW